MKNKKKMFLSAFFVMLCAMLMGMPASAASAKLNKTKASVVVGKTVQLKVKNSSKKVKWSSSNKKVATVNSKGLVTAKKKGTATTKAKVGSKTLKCKVTVKSNSWNAFSNWNTIGKCNQTGLNFVRAQPIKLSYNSSGNLVAQVAVQNNTLGYNYILKRMHIKITTGSYDGKVVAEKTKNFNNCIIEPLSVGTVKITFNKNTTKRVINLNNKKIYTSIATN